MGRPALPLGAHGQITTRLLDNGRTEASCRVRDLDGVTRRASASGRSSAEALRRLRAALSTRQAPTGAGDRLSASSTVSDLMDAWFVEEAERGRLSAGSLRTYRTAANAVARQVGAVRLAEATTPVLARRLRAMDTATPEAARQGRIVLHRAFRLAVQVGALQSNPARELDPVPKRQKPPIALTEAEVALLRQVVADYVAPRDELTGRIPPGPRPTALLPDAIDLFLATGVRIGEVLALRWVDVDLEGEAPTVTIASTLVQAPGGLVRQDHPKTDAGYRRLVLPDYAVEVLRRRLAERQPGHDLVFASRTGTAVAPHNLRRSLRKALAGTPLEGKLTPHTTRRTVATAVARSAGIDAARVQLGHATGAAITERAYVERLHVAPDLREVLDGLGG